eukprot:m.90064 g.90064  ORF g.90064 m.90064 type:complete len:72 (-) comp12299_c2_seq16:262-477(-)
MHTRTQKQLPENSLCLARLGNRMQRRTERHFVQFEADEKKGDKIHSTINIIIVINIFDFHKHTPSAAGNEL